MAYQFPIFSPDLIEQISKTLGDSMTGGEISGFFKRAGITEFPSESSTKWRRILASLIFQQETDNSSARICKFVESCMEPVRFISRRDEYENFRKSLNQALAFSGLFLQVDGKLILSKKVSNLDEAEERAQNLSSKLRGMRVHSEVLRFCKAELLQDNYFHAVLEATKSVSERIRNMTSLTTDGANLFDSAFSINYPLLAMNKLVTESEQSEQKGFINFLKGIFGLFRNPHAHSAKIVWKIQEHDALDLLVMVSYAHRKLDSCIRTPFPIKN